MPTDATEKNDMAIIGFVGYPNVGKSSVINVFMENKCLQVSATPGKVCSLKLLCLIRIFPKYNRICPDYHLSFSNIYFTCFIWCLTHIGNNGFGDNRQSIIKHMLLKEVRNLCIFY